jgi:hypothetical protein
MHTFDEPRSGVPGEPAGHPVIGLLADPGGFSSWFASS